MEKQNMAQIIGMLAIIEARMEDNQEDLLARIKPGTRRR
jgi:hypothetical protein